MFEHVLVPLDGSRLAECALPHAVAVARAFGSRCTLLRVLETGNNHGSPVPIDPLDWALMRAEAESYLEARVEGVADAGVRATGMLREGQPIRVIDEYARTAKVDLVVVSSHGHAGMNGSNLDGVAHQLVDQRCLSLLIARAYQPACPIDGLRYRKLLVPLDGSSRAECALGPAWRVAQTYGSEVVLCHAVTRPEPPRQSPFTSEDLELVNRWTRHGEKVATDYLRKIAARTAAPFRKRVNVSADIAATLHEVVDEEEADLVLMTAHGQTGTGRWPFGHLPMNLLMYGTTALLVLQDLSGELVEPTPAEMATRQYKGH